MQIVDKKAIVLRTRSPNKYNVIPRSKIIGEVAPGLHEVAVYFGLNEARVLRNLGVKDVPSPITVRYDWPGRYRPFKHQVDTASFLTMNRRAFCLNEPGTGKTLSALWAADYLMKRGEVRRVLILCPLSIMQSAWMRDIGNSVIHRTAVVCHHSKASRRIEMVQGDYEFVITNYDGLNLIADEVVSDGRFDLVIVDEANAYKNVATQRWKSLNKIISPNTMLWMMTGTPSAQSPLDAYGLAKLVNPSAVPRFFTAWRDKVMSKITMFKWAPKPTAHDAVFNALQPAIRFTKAECLDLPPVVTVTREVPLTAQQTKYYKILKDRMLVEAAGETITAVNAAAGMNKLLQISAGAAYSDTKEVIEFDCKPRLSVLMEVLQETDRKVIVFAPYRHSIDTIATHLSAQGIVAEQIHGDVSATKRAQIFKRFQETPDPQVLVIQPQSASHGVTLTAADTVVFWGPVMSVETYLQCCARADRVGQDSSKVLVVHIQGSEVERRLFERLKDRVADHSMLVDLYKEELDAKSKV
jgi:SNF2 family DNA or RNA helicase